MKYDDLGEKNCYVGLWDSIWVDVNKRVRRDLVTMKYLRIYHFFEHSWGILHPLPEEDEKK